MEKTVTVLGSTGSIGCSTLRVLKSLGQSYRVYGLGCGSNLSRLAEQIAAVNPVSVAVESKTACASDEFASLKAAFPAVEFLEGEGAITELASRRVDISVSAIVGAAGLAPSIKALSAAKRVALANKETLVMAGDLFMKMAADCRTELIPVDSEHSAIFSLIQNIKESDIERIILTASGGGLRDCPLERLKEVTPEMALSHPTWNMGKKITIDSATLVNKGLEVMEAHHLFSMDYDSIDILIHPESVIHSMAETVDGALYAHMGVADMAHPILNALKFPEKVRNKFGCLRLEDIGSLTFRKFDAERYPALSLCYEAGRTGGTMPAVLNAANEVAVDAFLKRKISFTDIVSIIEFSMKNHSVTANPDLNDIFAADLESREVSSNYIRSITV